MVDVKKAVKASYAKIAKTGVSCCASTSSCATESAIKISREIGYSEDEMRHVPEGANLGLGCGNPLALVLISEGDMVLDLGSGAGFDAFLAAGKVGARGRVIGVDMTPEMIERARLNAAKGGYENVEFRLGEIENLPLENQVIDIIISNCVINLSTDKKRVFQEAYRVLKPSGKAMISDIVLAQPLPEKIKSSVAAYAGCLAGAMLEEDYLQAMNEAGFSNIEIVQKDYFPIQWMASDPMAAAVIEKKAVTGEDLKLIERTVMSIKVKATK